MHPEIFTIGSLKVQGYGLMIALAIPIAILLMSWNARRLGFRKLAHRMPELAMLFMAAAFVGGKLGFILSHPEEFSALVREGGWKQGLMQGFVFYWAMLLQIPVTWWALRKLDVPVLRGFDALVVGVPVMHGMGRLGCFLAGCCYGCRTDLPWAVTFEHGIGLNGVAVHPVQIYEALGNLLLLGVLFWLGRDRSVPGRVLLGYIMGYAVIRFLSEFLRGDGNPVYAGADVQHVLGNPPSGLTQAQWLAIMTWLVGVPLWIYLHRRGRSRHGR